MKNKKLVLILLNIIENYLLSESQIIALIEIIKNNKIQQILYNLVSSDVNLVIKSKLYRFTIKNYKLLNNYDYDKKIDISFINTYTILKFNLDFSLGLKKLAVQCLKKILDKKKILSDGKIICLKDCVICDVFYSSLTKFNNYHTDIEYSKFTGNAFNVWYLIENNNFSGNVFLLKTNDYKKDYTPCVIEDDYNNNNLKVIRQKYSHKLLKYDEEIGYLNKNNINIKYLNIKNEECLVMTKHLLHRTDLSRNNNFKGFNFRVIIKNDDGSINYDGYDKIIKPYHNYCNKTKKIYGCKLTDFV